MRRQKTDTIRIFGAADEATVAQLERCVAAEDGAQGVLCPDNHLGYSAPIGAAIAYRDHVSPSGVGFDIGCGNKAVLTDLVLEDVAPSVAAIMDEIVARISFGLGRFNDEPIDHPVLDRIRHADFEPQRALADLAARQLGTVGAGNHYVDLFADEQDRVWVGVHFGSRGFGHKTASGFLSLAAGGRFDERPPSADMHAPPTLLRADSTLGESYIAAMELAGEYAYAGRDVVVDRVLEILGARALHTVHNHHNFAFREEHDGERWWVVRKGCTPAFAGQEGFVGATMGDESVILAGTERARPALFSTIHGAGRAMSRTKAAGKRRRRWVCANRGCDWVQPPRSSKPSRCPACGGRRLVKRWVQDRPGAIDWPAVQQGLAARGIELRGGDADEAPGVYKRLDEVLDACGDTIEIRHRLRPVGVAMAGPDVYDPFKD